MGNNNTLGVTVTVTLNGIDLLTRNDTGTGPNDAAAISTANYDETPLGVFAEEAGIVKDTGDDPEAGKCTSIPINLKGEEFSEWKKVFNNAVEYLSGISGEDFVNIVLYSRINFNKFPGNIKELADIANADDAWSSVLIDRARGINKEVEDTIFNVFTFDSDFIKILRSKKDVSIEAKVAAYKAMYNDDYNNMIWAFDELNRLERIYRKFMHDIKK